MRRAEYRNGQRNATKACVAWLHALADEMNDPHAKDILNTAAFGMGVHFKRAHSAMDAQQPRRAA